MFDRLVEIERNDWPVLKKLYNPDDLWNVISYSKIDNFIRWCELDPNIEETTFYSLNDDFSDGTFVVTNRLTAYADTKNEDYDRIFRLLVLLDHSKGFQFVSTRPEIRPLVIKAIQHTGNKLKLEQKIFLHCCPKQIALEFDVQPPEDIELKPLNELTDLEKIYASHPLCSTNIFHHLQQLIKYNVNVGAFNKDGTLVAWILRYPSGLVGVLHTDTEFRGRGYGVLVTKYISKKIAEMGLDVYAGIVEGNLPSKKLFTKIGFKPVGEVHWVNWEVNSE